MAEQSWWRRIITAIEHEYERRLRRASLLGEFKPVDDHHHSHAVATTISEHAVDEEEAVIVNVPRGTRIARHESQHAE
jgi:N-acyl-L-homoserine lactone synthetase